MTQKFYRCLCAFTLLIPAACAVSQDYDEIVFDPRAGFYIAGSAAAILDYDIGSSSIIGTGESLEFSLDDSTGFSLAVGAYLSQFRVELEANYFETDYSDIRFLTFPINIDGDLAYLSFLGNVYCDFPLGSDQLNLYVGAGAGVSIITSDADLDAGLISSTTVNGITTTTAITEIDDTFPTFTYQVMAGLSYEVVDNVTITGGYRLRGFGERSNEADLSGLTFQEHFVSSFELGLRIDF